MWWASKSDRTKMQQDTNITKLQAYAILDSSNYDRMETSVIWLNHDGFSTAVNQVHVFLHIRYKFLIDKGVRILKGKLNLPFRPHILTKPPLLENRRPQADRSPSKLTDRPPLDKRTVSPAAGNWLKSKHKKNSKWRRFVKLCGRNSGWSFL